ncbi:MAG: hypothetical protein HRU12_10270 [Phaeodactylibacter sp.]|nr:hypothetical protein [Phaeodactylibacter sp.]
MKEEGPNNFEKLLERQAKTIRPEVKEQTEQGLFKAFESLRLVGQLLDIFVPKMVDVLVVAAGGKANGNPPSTEPTEPKRPGSTPPGPKGPSLPEEGLDEIR